MKISGKVALALLAGGFVFATMAAETHAQGSKNNTPGDTKKSTPKADSTKPAQPPARTTAGQGNGQRNDTIKQSTTRMQSDANTVDTSTRTGKFLGAAPRGAKSELDAIGRKGTGVFENGVSPSNTTIQPAPVRISTTPAPVRFSTTTANGAAPSLRPTEVPSPRAAPNTGVGDRLRSLFRRSN